MCACVCGGEGGGDSVVLQGFVESSKVAMYGSSPRYIHCFLYHSLSSHISVIISL